MSRRIWWKITAAVFVLAVASGSVYLVRHFKNKQSVVPTVRVQRGTVVLNVYTRGELRPSKSAIIIAPPVWGSLQIIRMSPVGSLVKAGDVVLEFDPTEQEYNLEQNESKVQEAEQQIIKAKADTAVQAAQDKVGLLVARFDVRRAELEVQKNELVGEIDARKNRLALDEARRRLAQLEQDVKSRQVSGKATIAVLEQQRNQAKLNKDLAQRAIENMKVKAPIDGLITVKGNEDASGGFYYPGIVFPNYKPGDQVYPGRPVMEVLDLQHMEVGTKIDENDRGNVSTGQNAQIMVDLAPNFVYRGKLKTISGSASRKSWAASTMRTFDASFEFEKPDSRLRPGTGAQVVVEGSSLADKLFIPRQCVFEKNGKLVVFARKGAGFEPREIKISSQSESRAVIEGLAEGTEIALLDPTTAASSGTQTSNSSTPSVGAK